MKQRHWLERLVFVVLLATTACRADDLLPVAPLNVLPPRAGIGTHDPRSRVDPNAMPWRAIGKLQAAAVSLRMYCTGTLIGPATVLTAAHCLFNARTGRYFPPSSLHFLIGYDGGRDVGHALVRGFSVGGQYNPLRPLETLGNDWALVTLDTELGTPDRRLSIRDRPPERGIRVMIGGYGQDRSYALSADTSCHIVGDAVDHEQVRLLRHDCTAPHGLSGAPVLVQDNGVWQVGGIDVAAQLGAAKGLAVIIGGSVRHFRDLP